MTDTQVSQLEKFSMRGTQLLSAGRTMGLLSQADQLILHIKVYAEGGENSLHAHDNQDHAFFVLQGEMTMTGEDGTKTVLQPYEGIMVPRHAMYMFTSTGDENLVILRIGSRDPSPDGQRAALGNIRRSIDGNEIQNAGEPVPEEGKFFGV